MNEQLRLFASPRVPSARPPRPRRKPDPVEDVAADLLRLTADMAFEEINKGPRCGCPRPLAAVDADGDKRCVRCGREVRP